LIIFVSKGIINIRVEELMRNLIVFTLFSLFFSAPFLFSAWDEPDKSGNPPRTVKSVDLSRYTGVWYEIVKIPNRFQKKCAGNTTAEYRIRKDGRIEVINSCSDRDGNVIIAKGVAKIADDKTNAKLKVSFVKLLGIQLFWGDYWILGLDKDYRYAVVGDSKRKYGWVLAREKELNKAQWSEIELVLAEQGYDKNRFVKTTHSK
jgi:apolipoprotein D and lipocalin family protein